MLRSDALAQIEDKREPWDFLVIGGGATGLGIAVDAASRGYRTLLVEQHDFAKGTSSRSTKLVHGGVRYLRQGNISLVFEALRERGLLIENAPHLVRCLPFIIPVYQWWEAPFYGAGMKVYDRLAGRLGLSPSQILSRAETIRELPTIERSGLKRGVLYYDAQFDDARLAVNLAQTVWDLGGVAVNYFKLVDLIREHDVIAGALLRDEETGAEYEVRAKMVINATGVFSDALRRMDDPHARNIITASRGSHIVLPKAFLPGEAALMVPRTPDGRVLFAVPWREHVVVGTTDLPAEDVTLEPKPISEEVDFILSTSAKYLSKDPSESDVLSVFAGLRPLVRAGDTENTAAISRDHTIVVSRSRLLTITGGKWTTYRRMAQDAVDRAEVLAGFERKPCKTAHLRIHGATAESISKPSLRAYGADAAGLLSLIQAEPALGLQVHPGLPNVNAEVVWAVKHEMARTVEDVLARRTRALLLDAKASIASAWRVAELMARELGRDPAWVPAAVEEYRRVAERYLLP